MKLMKDYIAIVDYGMGNLGSIANMLKKIKAEAIITSDRATIEMACKLILPGVGAFDGGMRNLQERNLVEILNRKVLQEETPILGLCLGMQLFTQKSEEGSLPGLGWISAKTIRFTVTPTYPHLKIPHMGWNEIAIRHPHPVWGELLTNDEESRFYFVHSYHVVCDSPENILATSNYGIDFVAAVINKNIIGTQFHPEKSHIFGMKLLKGFINL